MQQCAFVVQPGGKSGQLMVFADDAVAGNEEQNGIVPTGVAHGASSLRLADALCYVAVTARLTIRYGAQGVPYALLKDCAVQFDGYVPHMKLLLKIGVYLLTDKELQRRCWWVGYARVWVCVYVCDGAAVVRYP